MRRLIAIVVAAAVACAVLAGVCLALPPQGDVDQGREYGYLCSSTKSESRDFVLGAMHDDSYLLLGSSELATAADMVSTAPDNVLRAYDCGYQFMYVGDAYDQSLWLAIAAGAYAPDLPNKKIGFIVSAQWFTDGGLEPGIFKMRFSYPLYAAFCANESIPKETKAYVAQRLRDEGVDGAIVDAGVGSMPQDVINAGAFGAMNDVRLRQSLDEVRALGSDLRWGTEPPDFDALRAQAVAEAEQICTNNEYAVFDAYWTEHLEPDYAALAGTMAGDTLTNTPEYDDFACFLDVARSCGLEPLVIIMPVNGKWYDYAGLSADARQQCYERVREMCAEAGVECLDLSPHEYTPYYLRDIMHFGWLGWLDVEEAFMEFVQ